MDLRKLIAEYLKQAYFMQIATVKNDQPWACTVHFASDDQLNLYWVSLTNTRHSQELRAHKKVAGTVVLAQAHDAPVRGLQFEGIAEELDGKSTLEGLRIYDKRYKVGKDWVEKVASGTEEFKCYKIKPSLFVLFDQVNFSDNPRHEYKV